MTEIANTKHPQPDVATRMLLIMAFVAPSFIITALGPVLPMLAAYFGGGPAGEILAQRAQALPFLGLVIGGLLAGAVLTRARVRPSLFAAAVGYGCAGVIAGFATTAAVILSALFVLGVFASMLNSALAVATGRAFEEGPKRTRILGFQIAMSDLAAIAASIIAGVAAQFFGWRAPLAIYPIFGLYILVLLAIVKIPQSASAESHHVKNGLSTIIRMAWPVYVAPIAYAMFIAAQAALLPFHLEANGFTDPSGRAMVLVTTPIFAMLASTVYGLAKGRMTDRQFFTIAIATSVAGYGGIAMLHGGILPFALAAAGTGIGIGFSVPMVIRAAFARVPAELHGHSMGLITTTTNLGAFLSPLVLGPVMRAIGGSNLFLLLAAAWLVGGVILIIFIKPKPLNDDAIDNIAVPSDSAPVAATVSKQLSGF